MMDGLFTLADRLVELRDRKDALQDELKAINAEIKEIDRELAEMMLSEELQNFSRNGRMFYLRTDTYVSAIADRKPDLIDWLKANGLGELVQETVHPRTLTATVKELLEEEGELPEGLTELVHVYEETTVGLRKATSGRR